MYFYFPYFMYYYSQVFGKNNKTSYNSAYAARLFSRAAKARIQKPRPNLPIRSTGEKIIPVSLMANFAYAQTLCEIRLWLQ